MKLALKEAFKARGNTFPNPPVGAVIVKNGKIVGRGHTQPPGGPHAEVIALKKAGRNARGAHLFVTLEPCNHFGRTPPCTEAIIKAGIAKTHYGFLDPNPLVRGKGIKKISQFGIPCFLENLGGEIDTFYGEYTFFVKHGRPKIILKVAQSLEGFIAAKPGVRSRISSEELTRWTHGLREKVDGILVGAATIKADNPQLNIRFKTERKHEPWILIMGRNSKSKIASFLKQKKSGRKLVVFDSLDPRPATDKNLSTLVWEPLKKNTKNPAAQLLDKLIHRGFHSVLVEGGAKTLQFWLNSGLWDEFYILQSPVSIPNGLPWATAGAKNWDKGAEIGKFMPFKNEAIWCFVPRANN